jgi:hypothetical protein
LRLDRRRFSVARGGDSPQDFIAQAEFGEGHSLEDRGTASAPFVGESPYQNERGYDFVSPRLEQRRAERRGP